MQPGAAANLTWVSASGAFAFDLQGEVNQVIDQVVARWHVIHEVGTNKELKGKDSFGALGSDSGLKISFPSENTLLAALEFRGGYKYLMTTGGIEDIRYRYMGLAYALPGVENITFDLDYVDGSDERTLQREKKWIAALAIRY